MKGNSRHTAKSSNICWHVNNRRHHRKGLCGYHEFQAAPRSRCSRIRPSNLDESPTLPTFPRRLLNQGNILCRAKTIYSTNHLNLLGQEPGCIATGTRARRAVSGQSTVGQRNTRISTVKTRTDKRPTVILAGT